METHPDPKAMAEFCETLPALLANVSGCTIKRGQRIARDIKAQAEAFAAQSRYHRDVLAAPFLEEAFFHEPAEGPASIKAGVTVVVRNSLLEDLHVQRKLNAEGIAGITTYAAGPLSHLIAYRNSNPAATHDHSLFDDIDSRYPRAWAALSSLPRPIGEGGEFPYGLPVGDRPPLPGPIEQIAVWRPKDNRGVLLSGVDERFDQDAVAAMAQAADGKLPVVVISALSRFSRNEAKLFRMVEFYLAHGTSILTSNYLITPRAVWIRSGELVRPSSGSYDAISDHTGLSGEHLEVARSAYHNLVG